MARDVDGRLRVDGVDDKLSVSAGSGTMQTLRMVRVTSPVWEESAHTCLDTIVGRRGGERDVSGGATT